MGFEALTIYDTIGVNTSFLIIEVPTVAGSSPKSLNAGDIVKVAFQDSSPMDISIVSITDRSAIFRCEDGTRWEMTPPTNADLIPLFPRADWAHQQKWIVRSKVA
jgi:hypothetical protein